MTPEKAVILAAGFGTRLGTITEETPKGLLKVAGREIIYRSMKILQELGVKEFIIITNRKYEDKFRKFVEENNFKARIVINEYPERGNGYSLYLAKSIVNEKFLLLMSDHIYGKAFLQEAVKGEGLIVDRNPRYVNIEEATKVKIRNNQVEDIGKHLKEFHGVDTGFFILTPDIFRIIEGILSDRDVLELSEIVKRAKLRVTFVDGLFWTDVDVPEDIKKAKDLIVKTSVKGVGDGFISRYLNRKISTRVSSLLVDYITPNQITVITFLLGIFSALLNFISVPLAGIMYQISSILDGVDGEIARASMKTSRFGGYVDSILDRYVDFTFLLLLAYVTIKEPIWWIIVKIAIFGSVMVSYSTECYRAVYGKSIYEEIPAMRYLIGKRDERAFLTMLFCLIGEIKALFVLLAVLTNLRVALTVWLVWKKHKVNSP